MDGSNAVLLSLDGFAGKVRLFPLPNLVVFPHVMQPLHIFEPRYRELLAEALESDKLIGMTLLSPGWETNYDGRPPIHSVGCLCRVATHQPLDDGKSNVLIVGLRRIKIVRELPATKSFREAEVELMEDIYPHEGTGGRAALQRRLLAEFKKALPKLVHAQEQVDHLLGAEIPLGMLTDLAGYTLDLNVHAKQELLAEADIDRRASMLLAQLQASEEPGAGLATDFPPNFSIN